MSRLHIQSYQENDDEISFDIKVMDNSEEDTFGWKHVTISKPLNAGKITAAINSAETDVLDSINADGNDPAGNAEAFIRQFIRQRNRGDV